MFVQRHPLRSYHHHQHQHYTAREAESTSAALHQLPRNLKKLSSAATIATLNLHVSGKLENPNDLSNRLNSHFKLNNELYNCLVSCISREDTKLERSRSLARSSSSLQDLKRSTSCNSVLLDILRRLDQSTGAETEPSLVNFTEIAEPKEWSGFIRNSLKNIWSFSYFWFDFVAYQIQTWRHLVESTLPINTTGVPFKCLKCVTETPLEPDQKPTPPISSTLTTHQTDNLMSFNDYYLAPNDKRYVFGSEKTMRDTRLRPRSMVGARNPLHRNLSLNVEVAAGPQSHHATDYYRQPQRPHSSRAEYQANTTNEPPLASRAGFNYNHRFYHQHFSADSITNRNNSKALLAKQLYSLQPATAPPRTFHTSNHLSVANDGYGALVSSAIRPHKATRRVPTTMNSCEHQSSALNSFDYSTGGEEAQCSLPVTKVELGSARRPVALDRQQIYLRHMEYQCRRATVRRQHCDTRPSSSMSYQRTYSEATDPQRVPRQGVETVASPRIRSDSDLVNSPNGKSNSLWLKGGGGERFHHAHAGATHHRSHEKVRSAHSSGSNATTSSQPLAEPTRTKSPAQLSAGSRKPNSSSLKLSLTGARKRLGFKQSGSNALIVQRSEEILPTEPNSFLCHQLNSYSPSSSCDTYQSNFFIEGLGPGQIVSRQGLVSPYLGDIQLTLTDRRGMLEVEVVRARRLQLKVGAKSLPAPYVKIYLMKDRKCISKWKTSTGLRTLDPLYQELFIFREDYAHCILQVIVWGYYGKKDKKSLMGVAQIHLNDLDISNLVIGWYKLFNAPSMTNSLHSSKNLRKMLTKNLTIAN